MFNCSLGNRKHSRKPLLCYSWGPAAATLRTCIVVALYSVKVICAAFVAWWLASAEAVRATQSHWDYSIVSASLLGLMWLLRKTFPKKASLSLFLYSLSYSKAIASLIIILKIFVRVNLSTKITFSLDDIWISTKNIVLLRVTHLTLDFHFHINLVWRLILVYSKVIFTYFIDIG